MSSTSPSSSSSRKGRPPSPTSSGCPPLSRIRRRQTARERLEERVGAGIVAARREVDVLRAQERRERVRVERADDVDALERRRRAPGERQLVARVVEVAVEPGERLTALAGVVRPARRDQPDPPPLERLAARRRMEDRRIDGVRDDHRVAELEPELAVLLERELRLEDRRGRELGVHRCDPRVCAVVEPSVDADRAVDAVHHPRAAFREPPQARDVEVERVEEAGGRLARDAVQLDRRGRETRARARAHGRTGARRPTGGGANSWKSARSARPRRVRSTSDLGADPPRRRRAPSGVPRARCPLPPRRHANLARPRCPRPAVSPEPSRHRRPATRGTSLDRGRSPHASTPAGALPLGERLCRRGLDRGRKTCDREDQRRGRGVPDHPPGRTSRPGWGIDALR